MSNFLDLPTKTATPQPTFAKHLLDYISTHFRDAHPEAFKQDVDILVSMRRDWVEAKSEAHPEVVKAYMRYHAQLAFLATKFPSDIGLQFAYFLPFPPTFSLSPDSPISLSSLTYERASVLFNTAALYASMAASERRAEAESIKRAIGYLTSAAGVLEYLIKNVLPTLKSEVSSPQAAGYDMTESFLGAVKEFVLAEAQECYWQQAVLAGSYKNGLIAKLSMKVSEYYKAALSSMNAAEYPSAAFFPATWVAHITTKQMHFEAAAQFRLSQDDLEKSRYGEEIARLRVAESLAKKGLDATKRGVTESVTTDLKQLQATVKSSLERAVRDNDLVYVSPIPPANQLAPVNGVGMVKVNIPTEVAEPVAWLMGGQAGMEPLFSALVPYGVHLALSIYDDRKDTLVRSLDGKREELDGLAASTLQSLNLPGSIQALERPVGLPPSLLKKAEEVESSGGTDRIRGLLDQVQRIARSNTQALNDAMDILDQEATEEETVLERQPEMKGTRMPSHVANQQLIGMAAQYEATIKQAAGSDATVRTKWEEWARLIGLLAGGEDTINDYVPSTGAASGSLPPSVRPLRASLEQLDDQIAHRARIINEAKHISAADDIRPQVLQEATRLAHGGTGDVKTEWFEDIFHKALDKYEGLRREIDEEAEKQDELLNRIRTQNEEFLSQRKDDPIVKERERRLQDMDLAYWKWREIVDNAEEGIKFYNSFAEMLGQFKATCTQFLNSRRQDINQITAQLQNIHVTQSEPQYQPSPEPAYIAPPAAQVHPSASPSPAHYQSPSPPAPAPAPAPRLPTPPHTFLAHPSSSNWESAEFLPPPPPPPILRSGGVQSQPKVAPQAATPRRVTRASAAAGNHEATERNKYSSGTPRRKGGGVV
ncbi:pH-response regulator protein palA/RIM20 [Cryptococcus amylolentus CBS 6039]|uniref:pH-response regulator protein palA/RIM20 n=1 Tax=Cryptococcus amylolentus CBS 6039 TaxID=1295533 RepID=A0A1E3H9X6_9TREE|nr:pH-response regulator protein palA/RIM20 [Cryptococcus amylolentus CBS 6039]ODN73147.1 pH-response regulator protein palA/RIM20 [Cryptococcus amylolentus CBS 6039]